MRRYERDILAIISNALDGGNRTVSDGFDFNATIKFAAEQQLFSILYAGVLNTPGIDESAVSDLYFKAMCKCLAVSENQMHDAREVCDALETAGVKHAAIKGVVLKGYYPTSEMRTMSDVDILFDCDEVKTVKSVMSSLGYKFLLESDHEYAWESPSGVEIELHKRLIPSYYRSLNAYYEDYRSKFIKKSDKEYEYAFKKEDEIIYHFAHFAKHYTSGGAGVKYVVDLYVLLKKYADADMEYIFAETKKLGTCEFFKNLLRVLDVWFGGEDSDDVVDFITDKIFSDGVYGKENVAHVVSGSVFETKSGETEKAAKRRFLINAIFPRYDYLKERYTVLKRLPILLPFAWCYRLIKTAIKHPKAIKCQLDFATEITDGTLAKRRSELRYVGIDN